MRLLKNISHYYTDAVKGIEIGDSRPSEYTSFELAGILATAALKFIMMEWLNMMAFYVAGISFFWIGYIIYRYLRDKNILSKWGFRKKGFSQTMIFILPFTIACIIVSIIVGLTSSSTTILNWRIIPVLLLYPLWGLFQQYIMLVLIADNLVELERLELKKYQAVMITAMLFSLVHYPSFFLMIFTFVMELIFLLAWFRWKNLLALGLTHGVTATLILFYILERDLWIELFEWF